MQPERSREKKARNKKQGVRAKKRMGLLVLGVYVLLFLFTAVKGFRRSASRSRCGFRLAVARACRKIVAPYIQEWRLCG